MFTSIEKTWWQPVNIVIITQKNTRIISKNLKLQILCGLLEHWKNDSLNLLYIYLFFKVSGCNQFSLATFK